MKNKPKMSKAGDESGENPGGRTREVRETLEAKKKRAGKIVERLRKAYPGAVCALTFSNPFELLAATILSAQCTDKRVNIVTPALFKRCSSVKDYAEIPPEELEKLIQSAGFYKNKAKSISGAAKQILERFGGEVPKTLEDLITLPGVGRKTANVLLGNAFGIPGLTVDTHMIRINRLLGLTKNTDPVKIEFELMPMIPQKNWTEYSHLIIHHGRARCVARRPDCEPCEILGLCPSGKNIIAQRKPRRAAPLIPH